MRREVDKSNTPDDNQRRAWGSVWGETESGSRYATEWTRPGDSAPAGVGGSVQVRVFVLVFVSRGGVLEG